MTTDNAGERVVEFDRIDRIDRSSAIPLYLQLEYLIRRDIESGGYRPGAPLPSEGEICARYEVSRSVVRQTLANLIHAGLVRTERGRGSFVAEKKLPERFVQRTTGLYDDLRRMGHHIRTRVVRQVETELPLPVREFLRVERGAQIDRVRSVDGRELAFIRSFVPTSRCPGLAEADLEDRSLYEVLANDYGLHVASGRRTVEAVAARGEVAAHLGVPAGEPVLLLRSSSRDEQGHPLEWFEAWHRGDRTMFEIEIVTGEQDQPVSSVVRTRPEVERARHAVDHPAAVPEGGGLAALGRSRVIAVLRAQRFRAVTEVVAALAGNGLRVLEIATTAENAWEAVSAARSVPGVVVGVGPVTTAEQARDAMAAGAEFLVAPLSAHAAVTQVGNPPLLLTGYTLNEIWAAWQATAAPVKVFPAAAAGPAYLATLASQLPGVPLLAAGGVELAQVADYLRAGAQSVAVGEALCPAEALAEGDVAAITSRARALVDQGLAASAEQPIRTTSSHVLDPSP